MGVPSRPLAQPELQSVVEHFDHRSVELAQDPFAIYATLRERCPIQRSEVWGGFWVVASHELVDEAAHDDARFSVAQGASFPTPGTPGR